MAVRIEYDSNALQHLMAAAQKSAEEAMDALKGNVKSAQVMPRDQGTLQNDMYVDMKQGSGEKMGASLRTTEAQARRLYFHPEYNFQQGQNPDAGGLWLEPWISGEKKDFLVDTFCEKFKEEAGL